MPSLPVCLCLLRGSSGGSRNSERQFAQRHEFEFKFETFTSLLDRRSAVMCTSPGRHAEEAASGAGNAWYAGRKFYVGG